MSPKPDKLDYPDPTGRRIYEPPGGLPDSFDDRSGTNHLFDELVCCALMIAWGIEEQIDEAPPELLEKLIVQVLEAEAYLADIKHWLGMTE